MPMLRNESGTLEPVDWERALILFCERFKEIQRKHGPESVAWLGTGQMTAIEELAFLGALGKIWHGHDPWRWQYAPVHGDCGYRIQGVLRLRRAALCLPGFRGIGRDRARRLESLHRAPDHVAARHAESKLSGDHRGRPAEDGDGNGGDPALRDQAEKRSYAALRAGEHSHRQRLGQA